MITINNDDFIKKLQDELGDNFSVEDDYVEDKYGILIEDTISEEQYVIMKDLDVWEFQVDEHGAEPIHTGGLNDEMIQQIVNKLKSDAKR